MVEKASERRGQHSLAGAVKLLDIKEEFDRIAGAQGVLGAPSGLPAYCYVRVSSEAQSEDGRTGLPRQMLHIHEKAAESGLCVPWELVFADPGYSGFEFENRPALSKLRSELSVSPRSKYLIIEHLDRLSRNAKWHQGYLLDEFERAGVTVVFWKGFGSEIERAVVGTVSEQGMRAEIQRMRDGYLIKAQKGWVPTKRPRYGYMYVDGAGRPKDSSRKETYYALHPEQSKTMRTIYERLIYEGWTLGRLSDQLNADGVPTRFNARVWCPATLSHMIKDPIYKGELYVNRYSQLPTGGYRADGKPKKKTIEKPRDEWLLIRVPAIVTPEEWELAQKRLEANRTRSPRNMRKREWLLSSMVRCSLCGYTFIAVVGGTKNTRIRYYGCGSRASYRAKLEGTACSSPYVKANALEELVWAEVTKVLYNPQLVIGYLEEQYRYGERAKLKERLASVSQQAEGLGEQLCRWRDAYLKGVIDLEEYEAYRRELRGRQSTLEQEKARLQLALEETVDLEEQKKVVLSGLSRLREQVGGDDLPFALKRKLLSLLVNDVWVNSKTGEVKIEGVIRSGVSLESGHFELGLTPRWR